MEAQITGIWLNGRSLDLTEYNLERKGQATFVRVIIAPEQKEEVFFLAVKYDCKPKQQGILEF